MARSGDLLRNPVTGHEYRILQAARIRWETRPALRTEQFFETLVALAEAGRVRPSGTPLLPELALLLRAFAAEMRPATPPLKVQRAVFGALAGFARVLGRRLPT